MFNLVRADLYKAAKSKMFWVLLTITLLCAVITTSIAYGIGNDLLNESLGSIGFLFSDMNMMSIIGAVLATLLISSDFNTRNIHHPIMSGYSRLEIVVSKAIVYWLLLFVLLFPFLMVTCIGLTMDTTFHMGSTAVGYLSILTNSADGNFGQYFVVLLTMTIVYLAQLSICLLLAFILKKSVLVIMAYYMMSMLFGQVASFKDSLEGLYHLLSYTPYSGEYITMNAGMSGSTLLLAIVTCIMFMMAVVLLTFMTFRKAEIK